MTVNLSDEQRQALKACSGQPLRVADEHSNKTYYLVDEEAFAHFQLADGEIDTRSLDALRLFVEEGMHGPDIPAEEVFASLREAARQIAQIGP